MKNRKEFFSFLNGFWTETELTRRAAYMTARSARAQRPLGTLKRTERAMTAACARRATSAAQPAASGYGTNHGKVFTMSTQGAR
jgi:hypothetical protein